MDTQNLTMVLLKTLKSETIQIAQIEHDFFLKDTELDEEGKVVDHEDIGVQSECNQKDSMKLLKN